MKNRHQWMWDVAQWAGIVVIYGTLLGAIVGWGRVVAESLQRFTQ